MLFRSIVSAESPEAVEAVMKAKIDYQVVDSANVRRAAYSAKWWYDEELDAWFVDGKLPALD